MSRSIAAKFIAFVLTACCLVALAASLAGVAILGYNQLYDTTLDELYQSNLHDRGYLIARDYARAYAAEALGSCPEAVLQELFSDSSSSNAESAWNGVIKQEDQVLDSVTGFPDAAVRFEYTFSVTYPSIIAPDTVPQNRSMEEMYQEAVRHVSVTVLENGEFVDYRLYYYESPVYTVIIQLDPGYPDGSDWALLELLFQNRYLLIASAALSLLLFAAFFVYLCCVAGRAPGSDQIRPGGLNRLPLDLYAGIIAGLCFLVVLIGFELLQWSYSGTLNQSTIILAMMLTVTLSLLVLTFLFALAAQLKCRGGYWWRNSLIGRILLLIFRGIRWILRGAFRLFGLLPVIWQWMLTAIAMAGSLGLTFLLGVTWDSFFLVFFLLAALVCMGIVCYGGYAFGTLLRGVKRMKSGDLNHKIPTKYLLGSFRGFAIALNALSETAVVAAQNQLRSERMKTELITNVSHDIKTPLTSIINYVDLLQKPHTPQEQAQYLEVLSRQSLRLKKLIDDLMEMSKASTGNLPVEITPIDAVEAINQALGEFSGKLAGAQLTPVFTPPEQPVMMLADGRLVWRVLSNLLSNAVKYALPGTRVYISAAKLGDSVMLSIKNISKEQLGVSADELMERFVRGDTARNTEGSGLGLNIAKSLMEVQHGRLKLLVDGDLFKVTLFFPGV